MTYTPHKPSIAHDTDQLRARIPGWGADLDPADRPSVPRESLDLVITGDHGEHPDRQPERWPRERSVEHTQLPPVFGTSCPPHGLSGVIRKHAYATYSEGQTAHWLLLVGADRVDTFESALRSFLTRRPDNPVTETGIKAELTRHGVRSRLGHGRTDLKHQWIDPFVVGAPWAAVAAAAWTTAKRLRRRVAPAAPAPSAYRPEVPTTDPGRWRRS